MKQLPVIILVLIILGGVWWFFGSGDVRAPEKETIRIPTVKSETFELESSLFEIKINHPELYGINQDIADSINKNIQGNLEIWSDSFVKDLPDEALFDERKHSLVGDFETKRLDEKFVSFHFTMSSMMSGAAHPFNFNVTLTYNLETGVSIGLDDLFVKDSDYLNVISKLALQKTKDAIKKITGQEIIDIEQKTIVTGTEAKIENYNAFALTDTGIEFYFDSYQVATYAVGPVTIEFTYEELKDILKPEFVK